jgi:hypothetical protein
MQQAGTKERTTTAAYTPFKSWRDAGTIHRIARSGFVERTSSSPDTFEYAAVASTLLCWRMMAIVSAITFSWCVIRTFNLRGIVHSTSRAA